MTKAGGESWSLDRIDDRTGRARFDLPLHSYGPYSYGPYGYGLYSYGL